MDDELTTTDPWYNDSTIVHNLVDELFTFNELTMVDAFETVEDGWDEGRQIKFWRMKYSGFSMDVSSQGHNQF